MGTNIKNFNNWNRLNEDDSYWGWINNIGAGLKTAVTGVEQKPVETQTKSEPKPEEKSKTSDKSAEPKKVEPIQQSTKIDNKEYTAKLQAISKKLGMEAKDLTIDPNSKLFINLDLTKPSNVELYSDICQQWIDIRKPLISKIQDPITGADFAEAAALVFSKTGVYVPPQLVLAQATLEGGFSKEKNKPLDTKNLFNVGNTDNGSIRSFDDKGNTLPGGDPKATWKGGILAYFDLLADRYLVPGKRTADDLVLGEFVNTHGNRYATSKSYEQGLLKLIDDINTRVIA